MLQAMAKRYPGRASVAAHLDTLTTLLQQLQLHLSRQGWEQALDSQQYLYQYLLVRPAVAVCARHIRPACAHRTVVQYVDVLTVCCGHQTGFNKRCSSRQTPFVRELCWKLNVLAPIMDSCRLA